MAGIEDYGVIWPQLWQQPVEAYGPNLRGMRVRARPKPCRESGRERERGRLSSSDYVARRTRETS